MSRGNDYLEDFFALNKPKIQTLMDRADCFKLIQDTLRGIQKGDIDSRSGTKSCRVALDRIMEIDKQIQAQFFSLDRFIPEELREPVLKIGPPTCSNCDQLITRLDISAVYCVSCWYGMIYGR